MEAFDVNFGTLGLLPEKKQFIVTQLLFHFCLKYYEAKLMAIQG